ncbi:MAG: hydrogenase maturation nickel metallochaperone HypA [Thermoplasmatales archaeon]|nr:hydrogenase maturation nickel metallochaperone HypA [Thermoplasmatales archaeon]
MHEVSVVSELVSAIISELEAHEVVGVDEVTLVVGELTNLGFEQMEFAYEIVTRDTILEGSKLTIVAEPIKVECLVCEYEGPVRSIVDDDFGHGSIPILSCPECGGRVLVVEGKTCRVGNIRAVTA